MKIKILLLCNALLFCAFGHANDPCEQQQSAAALAGQEYNREKAKLNTIDRRIHNIWSEHERVTAQLSEIAPGTNEALRQELTHQLSQIETNFDYQHQLRTAQSSVERNAFNNKEATANALLACITANSNGGGGGSIEPADQPDHPDGDDAQDYTNSDDAYDSGGSGRTCVVWTVHIVTIDPCREEDPNESCPTTREKRECLRYSDDP